MAAMDGFIEQNRQVLENLAGIIDGRRDALVARIRRIAEIPSPTFEETGRTEYLMDAFRAAGLKDVYSLPLGSVLGFTAKGGAPVDLLLAAHIDTVFPAGTDVSTRIEGGRLMGPGTGDDAANVAAIVTLAEILNETGIHPAGNIAFCGTVREEGLGNLGGITEVLDAMGRRVAAVIAVDGVMPNITHRSQAIRRYGVTVRGPGGHSWNHFGTPSAVHEAARMVAALASVEVPTDPRTTFNVGRISGGTSVNAIAQECYMEVDLRSLEREAVGDLETEFLRIVAEVPAAGIEVETKLIGHRPGASIDPEHDLVRTARSAGAYIGLGTALNAASTDAALALSRGIPAIAFGTYRGGGTHTLEEYLETESVTTGLKWLALTVLALSGIAI
jgi:tripeptide aminopeptidase